MAEVSRTVDRTCERMKAGEMGIEMQGSAARGEISASVQSRSLGVEATRMRTERTQVFGVIACYTGSAYPQEHADGVAWTTLSEASAVLSHDLRHLPLRSRSSVVVDAGDLTSGAGKSRATKKQSQTGSPLNAGVFDDADGQGVHHRSGKSTKTARGSATCILRAMR